MASLAKSAIQCQPKLKILKQFAFTDDARVFGSGSIPSMSGFVEQALTMFDKNLSRTGHEDLSLKMSQFTPH
ncbi:hypothetical protein HAX54_051426 [Datura stramonium]|uniref:Uncharacterized protein n=1 Tax=Datura stramonium TaxID=4076 RepID=A0ABS8WME0_DATST|nr:hypothetical protein [Datura stramonium]